MAAGSRFAFGFEMTCSRCENLDEYVRFRTRGELFRAIGTVRQALVDGDIEEIDAGPMKGMVAFGDLSDAGRLDDLSLYRFRCPDMSAPNTGCALSGALVRAVRHLSYNLNIG